MEGLSLDVIIGAGQFAMLAGIFYRMGNLSARIGVLERAAGVHHKTEATA